MQFRGLLWWNSLVCTSNCRRESARDSKKFPMNREKYVIWTVCDVAFSRSHNKMNFSFSFSRFVSVVTWFIWYAQCVLHILIECLCLFFSLFPGCPRPYLLQRLVESCSANAFTYTHSFLFYRHPYDDPCIEICFYVG